jgi:hypothetical protein
VRAQVEDGKDVDPWPVGARDRRRRSRARDAGEQLEQKAPASCV